MQSPYLISRGTGPYAGVASGPSTSSASSPYTTTSRNSNSNSNIYVMSNASPTVSSAIASTITSASAAPASVSAAVNGVKVADSSNSSQVAAQAVAVPLALASAQAAPSVSAPSASAPSASALVPASAVASQAPSLVPLSNVSVLHKNQPKQKPAVVVHAVAAPVAPSDLNSEDMKFPDLSYVDVQINLRLLSDLKEGEKVMVVGKFMQVDDRYIQSFRRYWSSDSRIRTLNFINHVIEWAQKYCEDALEKTKKGDAEQRKNNFEKLLNIQTLLRSSLTGLSRISATYGDDKHNLATIETFKSTIQTFCDQDLKKALEQTAL